MPTRVQWLIALVSWHCLRAGHHAVPVRSMLKAMPLLPPSPQGHHLCKTSKLGHAVPTWVQRLLCTLQLAPPSGWGLCRPQGMAYYRYRFVQSPVRHHSARWGPFHPLSANFLSSLFTFFGGKAAPWRVHLLRLCAKAGK